MVWFKPSLSSSTQYKNTQHLSQVQATTIVFILYCNTVLYYYNYTKNYVFLILTCTRINIHLTAALSALYALQCAFCNGTAMTAYINLFNKKIVTN